MADDTSDKKKEQARMPTYPICRSSAKVLIWSKEALMDLMDKYEISTATNKGLDGYTSKIREKINAFQKTLFACTMRCHHLNRIRLFSK